MCSYEKTEYHCKGCGKIYAAKLGDRQPCEDHSESDPCHTYDQAGDTKIDKDSKCPSCTETDSCTETK